MLPDTSVQIWDSLVTMLIKQINKASSLLTQWWSDPPDSLTPENHNIKSWCRFYLACHLKIFCLSVTKYDLVDRLIFCCSVRWIYSRWYRTLNPLTNASSATFSKVIRFPPNCIHLVWASDQCRAVFGKNKTHFVPVWVLIHFQESLPHGFLTANKTENK